MMGTLVVKRLTIKHRFYSDENFLNYFASKMIFQNILQNVVIYCIYLNILSHTLERSLDMIHFYTTRQINFT